MLWTVAAASLIAGLMIGLTGIGGVLVVPALTEFAGVPVDRAIAASMFGFLFAGVPAAFVHLRRAQLPARPLAALCITSAVGAVTGAATLDWLAPWAVRLFVALLALASGVHALFSKRSPEIGIPSERVLALLGVLVGYGSALSGTGGPVTLIPLLLALRTPIPLAIALGLGAQLPITLAATILHVAAGRIDFGLGTMLGMLLIAGTLSGAWLSGRASRRGLTVAVALTLVGVGLWYGYATLA